MQARHWLVTRPPRRGGQPAAPSQQCSRAQLCTCAMRSTVAQALHPMQHRYPMSFHTGKNPFCASHPKAPDRLGAGKVGTGVRPPPSLPPTPPSACINACRAPRHIHTQRSKVVHMRPLPPPPNAPSFKNSHTRPAATGCKTSVSCSLQTLLDSPSQIRPPDLLARGEG
jgi:hypothetical protein